VYILEVDLPTSLWDKVANIVVYVINVSSSFALMFKTSMEVWSGKIVNYYNITMFNA